MDFLFKVKDMPFHVPASIQDGKLFVVGTVPLPLPVVCARRVRPSGVGRGSSRSVWHAVPVASTIGPSSCSQDAPCISMLMDSLNFFLT